MSRNTLMYYTSLVLVWTLALACVLILADIAF